MVIQEKIGTTLMLCNFVEQNVKISADYLQLSVGTSTVTFEDTAVIAQPDNLWFANQGESYFSTLRVSVCRMKRLITIYQKSAHVFVEGAISLTIPMILSLTPIRFVMS
ncbi:hypothetical protein KIN20_012481 [Parelaphostrongylus tenuis]|uniref:Uncharacterized protein n=1 Tax=Parelaphostrongylus tenuis TaxID=148309 RepID=A0AAD5MAR3_PARTN|nr:hypothetical protein KIN20_012481 [Parelaphostrongylus tenuis]